MQASEFLPHLSESLAAKPVYSDPVECDGVTVITAATIRGGGGVNRGRERENSEGGGLGLGAQPVGAYVIKDGVVKWKPALDVSRIIFRGQLVAIVALSVAGWVLGRRRSRWSLLQ